MNYAQQRETRHRATGGEHGDRIASPRPSLSAERIRLADLRERQLSSIDLTPAPFDGFDTGCDS